MKGQTSISGFFTHKTQQARLSTANKTDISANSTRSGERHDDSAHPAGLCVIGESADQQDGPPLAKGAR
eukprot:5661494-Ditylum_brightwellii.AAC.1